MYNEEEYKRLFKVIKNGVELNTLALELNLKTVEVSGLIEALKIRGYDIDLRVKGDKIVVYKKNIVTVHSKWYGKIATVLFFVAIMFSLLSETFAELSKITLYLFYIAIDEICVKIHSINC